MSFTNVTAERIDIRDVSLHQHFHGDDHARSRYRADIDELLERYDTGFVGRSRELERLAGFVRQRTPGHLLVEAAGGLGKSALMAQLLLRAERGEMPGCRPSVVAFFVRNPGANEPADVLTAINGQLLSMLGRPGGTPYDVRALRTQFSELWAEAQALATAERPLLLLVDGLDEQAPGDLLVTHLLPESLGDWVHVVASSRPRPDVREQVASDHPLRTAPVLVLAGLESTDVRALLTRGGLDAATADAVAVRIHALARGEPLLAQHICQDVLGRGAGVLDEIEAAPPRGIHEYFLREVRGLDRAADAEATWNACAVLAVALGALSLDELAGVLEVGRRQARRALEPVDRYLVGRERLQLYHRNLYTGILDEMGEKEAAAWRARLVAWCQASAATTPVPRYVLEHYGTHLAHERRVDDALTLASPHWLREQRREFHTLIGFARDVDTAYGLCAAPAAAPEWPLDALRMAVVLGSLGSTAQNVPPEAVWLLARLGRADEAEGYAALAADAGAKVAALAACAAGLVSGPDETRGRELLMRALDAALGTARTTAVDDGIAMVVGAALRCQDAAVWQGVLARLLALDPAVATDLRHIVTLAEHAHRTGDAGPFERGRQHVDAMLAWFEAAMPRYLATRASLEGTPVPAGIEPFDMDEDTLEEAEDDFYSDVSVVAALALTLPDVLADPHLSERAETLMRAIPHGFLRAADLAAVAQARAVRGDASVALDLAGQAVSLPDAGSANAFVPELYVVLQLATCVPILAHETFADLRDSLVTRIAAVAATVPPHQASQGYESLVSAWTAIGRLDEMEALLAATVPAGGVYNDYGLRGLHAAIARGCASGGRLDRAVAILDALPPDVTRDTDRLAVMNTLVSAGRLDLAERVLARVCYRPNRVTALARTAAALERLGRRQDAETWLDRALAAATEFGDETARVGLLAEAGRALVAHGRVDAGRGLAARAEALNAPLGADRRSAPSDMSLALLCIELGDFEGFLRVAPRRGDTWGFRFLSRYADALMARDGAAALSTFFFEVLADEQPGLWPADAPERLAIRARIQRMLGYTTAARDSLAAAISTMRDLYARAEPVHGHAVAEVVRGLREAGEADEAAAWLERALAAGFGLTVEESLGRLARAFADLGLQDRATTVASDALAAVDFSARYTNMDGVYDALMACEPADLPAVATRFMARAHAGRAGYAETAATHAVRALQDRQQDEAAIRLLFETLPLFRGEPRSTLLWAIATCAPLLARRDADGLERLCAWVEQVTGWWERA